MCRYTTIKSGRRRLLVPNSAFITREFMILDDPQDNGAVSPRRRSIDSAPPEPQHQPAEYAMPPPPGHQQTVPHDWVQRSLESQPFHRDPLQQPAHMAASTYQHVPADTNGRYACIFSQAIGLLVSTIRRRAAACCRTMVIDCAEYSVCLQGTA